MKIQGNIYSQKKYLTHNNILVTCLGFILLFDITSVFGLSVPGALGELSGVGLAVITLLKKPLGNQPGTKWLQFALISMAFCLVLTSLLNTSFVLSRTGHICAWALVVFGLASGRIHLPSLARGLAGGLFVGAMAGIVLLPQSNYAGRLTGFFGDPNTAAFELLLGCCISLCFINRRTMQVILILVTLLAVFLTGSRTALLAIAVMVIWIFLVTWLPRWIGFLFVGAIVGWVFLSNQLGFAIGLFQDRAGSDVLRDTISAAERAKVGSGSFFGQGLGEGFVILPDGDFFLFHSSYLAGLVEFGWITTVLLVGTFALALWKLKSVVPRGRAVLVEAALIAVFICALNVGEIFLTMPAAAALGVAAHVAAQSNLKSKPLPTARGGVQR